MWLRIIIYAILLGSIYLGLRRIFKDWKGHAKKLDDEQHKRDLRERKRPDVVELQKGEDGVFRPQSKNEKDK